MADDPRDDVRQRIRSIIDKVPPSIASAGATTTEKYKAAVHAARKALNSSKSTLASLQQAYANLNLHWN